MHVAGIIAEYNPFHNGHLFHLDETRKKGATHIVAVMSGCFTQRGEPAVISKFERARVAAILGVDLVIELPLAYATASSERFAFGAVSLLDSLGVIKTLSFGSESGNIYKLRSAADAVSDSRVIRRTKQLTEMGENYPAARNKAIEVFYPDIAKIIQLPNNILGIDYLKALNRTKSHMNPVTVKRMGAEHNGERVSGNFASAAKIRELIIEQDDFSGLVPKESELSLLDAAISGKISFGMDRIESAVLMKLRGMTREAMNLIPDASTGLGDRLFNSIGEASSIESLYSMAKTKRYTMSRVKRAVTAALFNITEADYIPHPYIRMLAIGKNGGDILREMKKKCNIPVSGSVTELIELKGSAAKTIKRECQATDIYNLTLDKRGPASEDFITKLFTV